MTQAVLLVGGQGTRLRPLTVVTPKPLLPVAGVPFLRHVLARAGAAGVTRVVLATSYRAEVFAEYLSDSADLGLDLVHTVEEVPLGTGGAVRHAAGLLTCGPDDPVLVFNGDILSGVDLAGLVSAHHDARADATLHLTRVEDPRAFGLVPTDETGRVLAFTEKPQRPEQVVTDQVNAGCYVFTRAVIDEIPAGRPVSVERETFPALLAAGRPLQGVVDETYWLDIGSPAAYVRGSADLVLGRVGSPALPGTPGERLVMPGASVDPSAVVTGGSTVGPRACVGADAVVDGSVLLEGAVVEAGARVRASAVGAGATVGAGTVLDGAVLGDRVTVGPGNELLGGVRVWPGAEIAAGAVRFSSDA
ncbi:MAG: sugar phosphate nucleotidyltransferase [Actinomycetes bacterium]